MRAATDALPALEIAVRGAGGTLARGQLVGIHAEAHGTARIAPLEAGFEQDAVQAFGLGLFLHLAGAGDDQRLHTVGDFAAFGDVGSGTDVLDAAVGAGADEDDVYL